MDRWCLLGAMALSCAACGESGLFGGGASTQTSASTTSASSASSTGGAPGTGGQAMTSSVGAQGGSPSTSGQGGTPSMGGLGDPCLWGAEPCNQGLYCKADGCMAGKCEVIPDKPAQQKHYEPVCGCDGITFFNPSIAHSYAMSIRHGGACTPDEQVPCQNAPQNCGANYHCNREVNGFQECLFSGESGVCWALPSECDDGKPEGKTCIGAVFCTSVCKLIQNQNSWYQDLTCN